MKNLTYTKKLIITISSVVIIILTILTKTRMQTHSSHIMDDKCLVDNCRELLRGLVAFLQRKELLRKICIAANSLLIDTIQFIFLYFYVIEGIQPLIFNIIVFYTLRCSCLYLAGEWPLPDPYIFDDPGIPSFFVPYAATHDLYFSGHIGNITMTCMLSYYFSHYGLGNGTLVMVFFTTFLMIVTGGHYTNDLLIGALAGIFAVHVGLRAMYGLTYRVLTYYCMFLGRVFGNKHQPKFQQESQMFLSVQSDADAIIDG